MKIVFVTNFMSHHQLGVAEILYEHFGNGHFYFVEQEELTEERKSLGYKDSERPYIIKDYEEGFPKTKEIIKDADAVIITYSQGVKPIKEYMKNKGIVFWYLERLYKDYKLSWTIAKYIRARHFIKTGHNKNQYFLCASAYGEEDLRHTAPSYAKNRCFKYGYYPSFVLDPVEKRESVDFPSFLYIGRFMELKHAEYLIYAAEEFKKEGIKAHFNLVGKGPSEEELKSLVKELGVEELVSFYPPCKASEVKNYYNKNDFFCFTSDRRDGYGSTLAEAMSCGCVSLASIEPGATNLFVKDDVNGIVFKGKEDFIKKAKYCAEMFNSEKYKEIQKESLRTVKEEWNYKVAGERLCKILENVINKKETNIYNDGPLATMNYIK